MICELSYSFLPCSYDKEVFCATLLSASPTAYKSSIDACWPISRARPVDRDGRPCTPLIWMVLCQYLPDRYLGVRTSCNLPALPDLWKENLPEDQTTMCHRGEGKGWREYYRKALLKVKNHWTTMEI